MVSLFAETGNLVLESERRQLDPARSVTEIVSARIEGPPLVLIDRWVVEQLPTWAKVGDDLIEIGPYIFRRTDDYEAACQAYYWTVLGHSEWYWLYWRTMRGLQWVWWRLLLTLAVWGLANWPAYGSYPTWSDVVARWRRPVHNMKGSPHEKANSVPAE